MHQHQPQTGTFLNVPSISASVEKMADRIPEVSLRESLTRVFLRPWLFLICLVLPPLLAITLASLIPPTYKASVKILIRYGASESAFLRDLIPENRAALSGLSSAEILRSLPSIMATVRSQGIEETDIAKSTKDILSGYVSKFTSVFIAEDAQPNVPPGVDAKTLRIAESLKASLLDTTGGSASTKSVEVLEKGMGSIPASQKGDELITLTVPSFNRSKVASMANGLAESFIAEYAELSAAEAHKSVVFLDALIADAGRRSESLRLGGQRLQRDTGAATSEDAYRRSPILERVSSELAIRQAELARVASIYPANAPLVVNARAVVDSLRASLETSEGNEIRKLAVEQLQLRRYQASNTERLFRDGLVPITIVERAVEPKRAVVATKYVVSAGVGIVLGLMLALSLVVVLSIVDERVHTISDVERVTGLPILGRLPILRRSTGKENLARYRSPAAEEALLQLLGRLDMLPRTNRGLAVVIASAVAGEGKTSVIAGLASMLAQGGKQRVLMVDADFAGHELTQMFSEADTPGLIDAMLDQTPFQQVVRPCGLPGISIVGCGRSVRRSQLGFYREQFEEAISSARGAFDFVIVDTGGVLDTNEAAMCGTSVDGVLWVACAGLSRKSSMRAAITKMADLGMYPLGVVVNRTRQIVPSFIWRNV